MNRRFSLPRFSLWVGASLGGVVLAAAVVILVFGGAILNRYGKVKLERAFAEAHPGYVLRIGKLDYAVGANRLVARCVTVSATNATLKVGRIALTGIRWSGLLRGTVVLADAVAKTSLDAKNLDVQFPQSHYGIRCARVRASVPASELIVEGVELRPLLREEAFFAAHDSRTTRFHVVVPECKVLGLAYRDLLQGKSYRARSICFCRPFFDALVNRDKPTKPFAKSPLMVHEALAAIGRPLQVDRLSITNGNLRYGERLTLGADPGVLTFGAVNITAEGIANRGEAAAAVQLQAQGELMNAGTLKVRMSIPIDSRDFSFHYSGSLGAMDLTRLNAFLDIAEHTRIKSGNAREAAFEIDVTSGQARGRVRGIYKDLAIAMLDKQTGSEDGPVDRVASFFANVLKIRNANVPDGPSSMKEGKVNYTKKPEDEFLQFAWFALRSGVMDIISH